MSKFKVGDRVAVYGSAGPHPTLEGEFVLFLRGHRGTVADGSEGDDLVVRMDKASATPAGHEVEVHAKPCRRLVKKTRRRVWVKLPTDFHPQHRTNGMVSVDPVGGWTEFVEVRRKGGKS